MEIRNGQRLSLKQKPRNLLIFTFDTCMLLCCTCKIHLRSMRRRLKEMAYGFQMVYFSVGESRKAGGGSISYIPAGGPRDEAFYPQVPPSGSPPPPPPQPTRNFQAATHSNITANVEENKIPPNVT